MTWWQREYCLKVNLHFFSLSRNYSYLHILWNVGEPSWSWIPMDHIQVQSENLNFFVACLLSDLIFVLSVYWYTTCRTEPCQPFGSVITWNILMMMMKTMTDDHDDTLNFGKFHINFISNTSKDDRFLNRGFRLFLQRSWQICQRCWEKKEPFRFHFLKFEGWDSNHP